MIYLRNGILLILIKCVFRMHKTSTTASRPKILAISAGPNKRLNQKPVNSPRRPSSQKPKVAVTYGTSKTVVTAQKPLTQKRNTRPIPATESNGKLSVDQILKQLSCANEKILDDV